MACCGKAPGTNVINEITSQSFQGNVCVTTKDINPLVVFQIYLFHIAMFNLLN